MVIYTDCKIQHRRAVLNEERQCGIVQCTKCTQVAQTTKNVKVGCSLTAKRQDDSFKGYAKNAYSEKPVTDKNN